jgi:hypothetical protein
MPNRVRTPRWAAEIVCGAAVLVTAYLLAAALPAWVLAAMTVLGVILVTDALIPVAQRMFPVAATDEYEKLLVNALTLVGTLYAVVVGFAVVVVWQSVTDTQQTISTEANALANLEHISRGYPVEVRRQVLEAAQTYDRLVIHDEWPAMEHGESSERADAALVELWGVYTDMSPEHRGNQLYQESVDTLSTLADSRRLRLLAAADNVPMIMWMLIYLGAGLILVLCFAVGVSGQWRGRIIVASLSGTLAITIFLVAALDGPFKGALRVAPDAFVNVLATMQNLEK